MKVPEVYPGFFEGVSTGCRSMTQGSSADKLYVIAF